MKRITMLLAFVGSFALQAQVPCNQTQVSNNFENGSFIFGFANGGQTIANDFIVTGGTTVFTVESITANLLSTAGIATVDVAFYSDNSGFPGSQIGSTITITPTSQTVIGTAFGYDVHEVILDLPAPEAFVGSGNDTVDATYWVSLVAVPNTGSDPIAWEHTSVGVIGNPESYKNPNTNGAWSPSINNNGTPGNPSDDFPIDGVFTISGTCVGEPLGLQNKALAQISLYPNPVQEQLNIDLPSSIELKFVAIFNLLGEKTDIMPISENNTLNMSDLTSGVYILKLETSEGTFAKKVINPVKLCGMYINA